MDKSQTDYFKRGELAALVGMSTRTIRYYEEIGLLHSAKRVEGGKRVYTEAFRLGKLSFKENNILQAIHYYSLILKGSRLELLGGTYFSLGEIFYQQEKYDNASRSFEMALRYLQESSPWFFLTHLEIANLQRKQGRYEEARRSYLTILNQPKDEDIKRAATELLRHIGSEK